LLHLVGLTFIYLFTTVRLLLFQIKTNKSTDVLLTPFH